jgi:hypothetical protein
MTKIFWKIPLPVTRRGFKVMMLKPKNNPHTDESCFASLQVSTNVHKWKQRCFVFWSRHCALWICFSQSTFLCDSSETSAGRGTKKTDLKCGLREADYSITIIHLLTLHCQLDNFWQNIQPPYSYDLSPPTFFSLNTKLPLTEEDAVEHITNNAMNDFKDTKHPSNCASNSGKGGGRGALLCKETVLKGI